MNTYVYKDTICTFCKKQILLSQPIYMSNCMAFCSPICRKTYFCKQQSMQRFTV